MEEEGREEDQGEEAIEKGDEKGDERVVKEKGEMEVLELSGSQRAIENLLKVYYEPLELWFLRTSIEKVGHYPSVPVHQAWIFTNIRP